MHVRIMVRGLLFVAGVAVAWQPSVALQAEAAAGSAHAPCTGLSLTGDLTAVVASCESLIRARILTGRDKAEALRHQGDALFRSNRVEVALGNYVEAVSLAPDWAKAHWNMGNALAVLGDGDGAKAAYQNALRSDPRFAPVYTALGIQSLDQGDAQGALKHFSAALEINGSEHHARLNRALVFQQLDRPADALPDFDTLLTVDPEELNDVYVHWNRNYNRDFVSEVGFQRAMALVELGAWDEAEDQLEATLTWNPHYVPAATVLANLLGVDIESSGEALQMLERTLKLQPEAPELHLSKARILSKISDTEGSREVLAGTARFEASAAPDFFWGRAYIWRGIGHYEEAEQDFSIAMSRDHKIYLSMIDAMRRRSYFSQSSTVDVHAALANAVAACARDPRC